jgi:hypothetical protein
LLLSFFSQRRSEAAMAQRMKSFFPSHKSLPSIMQPFACHPEEARIYELNNGKCCNQYHCKKLSFTALIHKSLSAKAEQAVPQDDK